MSFVCTPKHTRVQLVSISYFLLWYKVQQLPGTICQHIPPQLFSNSSEQLCAFRLPLFASVWAQPYIQHILLRRWRFGTSSWIFYRKGCYCCVATTHSPHCCTIGSRRNLCWSRQLSCTRLGIAEDSRIETASHIKLQRTCHIQSFFERIESKEFCLAAAFLKGCEHVFHLQSQGHSYKPHQPLK